jgi:acetylornithine deacetylase/succinyl-diaminopimelate desuccinylase-like protein
MPQNPILPQRHNKVPSARLVIGATDAQKRQRLISSSIAIVWMEDSGENMRLIALTLGLMIATTCLAEGVDRELLGEQAVERLVEYLQIDTTNPPGNEDRAVAFFAKIFDDEGVAYESGDSAPGRGNIWAVLEGGRKPALILLNHSDVVPADASAWDEPPFSGNIKDGEIWGRGALDMKGTGILQLQAFLALHREGRRLNRDVIFVATADEEAGGYFGAGWFAKQQARLVKGAGYLLNEGGGGSLMEGGIAVFGIEVTQKVPLWLRLEAHGNPSHGASPRVESSVTRLIRALNRIIEYDFEPRVLPALDELFKGTADLARPDLVESFQNMSEAVKDREFLLTLQLYRPSTNSSIRNTCSITRLEGSPKINVVPPMSAAELDCRLLPDQEPDAFIEQLTAIMNEPDISISKLLSFTPAVSPSDTELFAVIKDVMTREFPNSRVLPTMSVGFTDSHFFRELGITSYGFSPMLRDPAKMKPGEGPHGHNERVSVENIERGTRLMLEMLERFVYD